MILRLCAFLALLTACGGESNSGFKAGVVTGVPNGEWSREDGKTHPLAGAWRSGCSSVGPGEARQIELRVFDDRVLLIHFHFYDTDCRQPNFEQVIRIDALPVRTDAEESWELRADSDSVGDVLIAANSPQSARLMNQGSCLSRGWTVNRARSVYGTSCFSKGTSLGTYRLYRRRGDRYIHLKYPNTEAGAWLGSRL